MANKKVTDVFNDAWPYTMQFTNITETSTNNVVTTVYETPDTVAGACRMEVIAGTFYSSRLGIKRADIIIDKVMLDDHTTTLGNPNYSLLSQSRNSKDLPNTEYEVILFYNGLGIPIRHILDSRGAIPSKIDADAKIAIQEMAEYSQKWHNGTSRSRSTKTSDGFTVIQAQLKNLGREIKKVNKKSMLLKLDANNAKDPITPKIAHSKKKGNPSKKLTTRNLVDLFNEGHIEQ
ncbi:hypothetical protein Tco_1085536 [Tanacetum coccineum]